jgi:2-phosphoglycolate phosphatase
VPNDAEPPAGRVRAVLFDFDGTLADSYPAITASVNHLRAHHGLPPLPEAEVRRHVGLGLEYLMGRVVPGGDPAADVARYRAHHPSVMGPGTRLMPGAAEALAALHAAGLRLAVCSNKLSEFTRQLLQTLGVAGYVAAVLGPELVARPKPAPDMLLAALQRLGAAPAEAVYVGDMSVDVAAARAAGVTVWIVPTGSEPEATVRAAAPDRVLGGLDEVPRLLGVC